MADWCVMYFTSNLTFSSPEQVVLLPEPGQEMAKALLSDLFMYPKNHKNALT